MNKKIRKQFYFLSSLFFRRRTIVPSREEIDVIIPVIEKDLLILPLCLEGIKHALVNRIKNIYIVAPNVHAILDFCATNHVLFIDEVSVLGYGPREINYKVGDVDRSGWIFQQLLKLSGTMGDCEHFLVIDADNILIAPHTFFTSDHKYVFYQSKEFHAPYHQIAQQLIGALSIPLLSYVDHKMLFSKAILAKLKARITEKASQESWDKIILKNLDTNEMSSFSEYETYGMFVPKSQKRLLPWRNKTLRYDALLSYDELCDKYAKRYLSVTFPEYMNY
ncbi:MAG: DUF6492 family protein [Bacteroidaceae bacterium]